MRQSLAYTFLSYATLPYLLCLIGRGNSGNFSVPDIIILFHALFGDNSFSMGVVIAKRLSLNRTKGPIFGGIYVARLAKYFEIPIRHDQEEETFLPLTFLDYRSMVAHEFIVYNDDKMLLYNLRFNKKHNEIITQPAPSLFDLTACHYCALPKAVYAHQGHTSTPEPEPEPPLDPYRSSCYLWDPEEMASQWYPNYTPQYTGESSRGPWQ